MYTNYTLMLSPLNETYGIENFSETTREILRETDSLFNTLYLQESYADQLFLTEAVENNKNILIKGLEKLIEAIKALSQKFITLSTRLTVTNKAWLEKVKSANLNETVSEKFTYDIFPYWKGESLLRDYRFPEFSETPEFIQELGNIEEFKQKHFKNLYLTVDNKTEFAPKEVFQGGHTKIKMDKKLLLNQFSNMLKYIETYDALAKSINNRNNRIMELIRTAISKIRTTIFRESNELLTTINTLLEQGQPNPNLPAVQGSTAVAKTNGPSTSSDLEKDPGKAVDPNNQDKREDGKQPDKTSKDAIRAREAYNKLVYSINAARMGIAEACYNEYAKAIHAAMSGSNGTNPDTTPAPGKAAQQQPTKQAQPAQK